MLGQLLKPDFEELIQAKDWDTLRETISELPRALEALFAIARERFVEELQAWPVDVRTHALALAERAFSSG